MTKLKVLMGFHERSLQRLNFQWNEYSRRESFDEVKKRLGINGEREDLFSQDLNLFGPHSLFEWINSCQTLMGEKTLASWLINPANPEEITKRQLAIQELARDLDFRLEFAVNAYAEETKDGPWESFFAWVENPGWLEEKRPLLWTVRFLTILSMIFLIGEFFQIFPYPFWILSISINLFLSYFFKGKMDSLYHQIIHKEKRLRKYDGSFLKILQKTFLSSKCQEIQSELKKSHFSVPGPLRNFSMILGLASIREIVLYYVFSQAIFLLDFHLLFILEKWKRKFGQDLQKNFLILGEFEALCSLAAITHDYSHWTFPQVLEDAKGLVAIGLAHPLISPEKAVGNDFNLGKDLKFFLIMGSNMSGKSTFLRALGTNLVLAQAGSPVHAKSFLLPPVILGVSLRVEDSLEKGVSYYFAELLRIKEMLNHFSQVKEKNKQGMLIFLLDEILRGTNSHDRVFVASSVISHLMQLGATGIVTTQDENLKEANNLQDKFHLYYFYEQIFEQEGEVNLEFSYKLQEGDSPNTNGIKLAKILGIIK